MYYADYFWGITLVFWLREVMLRFAKLLNNNFILFGHAWVQAALLAFLLLAVSVYAPADSYTNPIVPGMNPDPSIVRTGDDYHLTTSTFEFFPGCALHHSKDLVHWTMIGAALDRPEQFVALKNEHPALYACTLRYYEGTYYVLTTDVRSG